MIKYVDIGSSESAFPPEPDEEKTLYKMCGNMSCLVCPFDDFSTIDGEALCDKIDIDQLEWILDHEDSIRDSFDL